MSVSSSTVYQSGQVVPVAGVYEVVGIKQPRTSADKKECSVQELNVGDLFPNFDGRAVSWHLRQENSETMAAKH